MGLKFNFDDAVFTYMVSDEKISFFSGHKQIEGTDFFLNHTGKTEVKYWGRENKNVFIIGLCVDSYGKIERDEIPRYLVQKRYEGIADLFMQCGRFAGNYVIILVDGQDIYLWGDATGSIQINYDYKDGKFCASSTDKMVARQFCRTVSKEAKAIRMAADLTERLPNDLTMYESVKALLPNHYLHVNEKKAVRVPLAVGPIDKKDSYSLKKLVKRTFVRTHTIAQEYAKYYGLVCPLTSGYDSRVVFSFLKKQNPEIPCYTFRHKGFTDKTDDIKIPKEICSHYNQAHIVIDDEQAPEAYVNSVYAYSGHYQANTTIDLAYTYRLAFRKEALVNGNNIGETAKSFTGHAVPNCFAAPSYFQCKMHNSNPQIKEYIKTYIDEVKRSGEWDFIYDLFELENFCGRWCSQGGTLYALCGVTSLNIFNSRDLLLDWISIPRELRVNRWLHRQYMNWNDKQLLAYAFNPHFKYNSFRKNWVLFYVATYMQQMLLQMKRKSIRGRK